MKLLFQSLINQLFKESVLRLWKYFTNNNVSKECFASYQATQAVLVWSSTWISLSEGEASLDKSWKVASSPMLHHHFVFQDNFNILNRDCENQVWSWYDKEQEKRKTKKQQLLTVWNKNRLHLEGVGKDYN